MKPLGFTRHDHDACLRDGLAVAEAQCRRERLQLTPVRRRVLEILLAEHRALGAYDILERLRDEGLGSQPPVAYRALDFLVSHGFAHRIERLNAFIACAHPRHDHSPAFLICRACRSVAEADAATARTSLAGPARAAGFCIERTVIEALGLCPECRKGNTA